MTNEELVQEYQNGNYEVLDELMEQNTGLVMFFAHKYKGIGEKAFWEFDDLVQEGWTGFLDAVEKYKPLQDDIEETEEQETEELASSEEEPKKAAKFSTFASLLIQHKILRAVNNNIAREKKSDIYSDPIKMNSIHMLLPGSENTTLEESLPDENSIEPYKEVESNLDNKILRKDLFELMDIVFNDELQIGYEDPFRGVDNNTSYFGKLNWISPRKVLLLHYGLIGKPTTFKEIGEDVGLSSARIEQIHYRGLAAIRRNPFGKLFVEKYVHYYFDGLEKKKESINQYASPVEVLSQMEAIDGLLERFI